MKAMMFYQYGSPDVLREAEISKPVPKENEVLIRVHAAALNAADWRILRATPFLVRLMMGLFKPRINILGADVAGIIETVGANVSRFKPGDKVYCDTFSSNLGGFAEYVTVRENCVVHKPENLAFEEAACVPLAGITALQAIRDYAKVTRGQHVLINGSSGGVGTFAVQIAKAYGAEVTAVCGKGKSAQMYGLGADHVIDYTQEDVTTYENTFDVIVAVNGYHPIWNYARALKRGGTYVMAGGNNAQLFQALIMGPVMSLMSSKKMKNASAKTTTDDLLVLKQLLEAQTIKPVIDRKYPLRDLAEAMRYLEKGHASGKIVLTV